MEKVQKRTAGIAVRFLVFMSAAALLVFGGNAGAVRGAEKRTVRIGFFPMEGYHETRADGSRTGMDVEYLEALCDYVNWNIEYVECESWDDALTMLSMEQMN